MIEKHTDGVRQRCSRVVVERKQRGKISGAVLVCLFHRTIRNKEDNNGHNRQGSVLFHPFRDFLSEPRLLLISLRIMAENVLRRAYNDNNGSTCGDEIRMCLCHTTIQTVGHMAYLPWKRSS